MKLAITSGLIIGMAIILLHVLINILIYGEVVIKEPNGIILWAELVLMPAVILYGVYLFIDGRE